MICQGKENNQMERIYQLATRSLEQKSELNEPLIHCHGEERSSSASVAGNEIISQSHCKVKVNEFSSDVSDCNAEKPRTGTSEDNEGSASEIQASEELIA